MNRATDVDPPPSRRRTPAPPVAVRRASPALVRVFAAAMAVVVVHVVDTGLVNLAPDGSRVEHLGAVVFPTAAAVLAAWLLPRLRPLAQAGLMLAAAILAVTEGTLEMSGVLSAGAAWDDVSGALVLAAGVVLVCAGTVHLTRGRDRSGSRWWVPLRRILWGGLFATVAAGLVGPVAVGLMAVNLPGGESGSTGPAHSAMEVELRARDGVALAGRYIPSLNGAAVIVTPATSQAHADVLVRHGYGVLLLDNRGEGRSGGDANDLGWEASVDLSAGLDYLLARPEVVDGGIGGLGLSVGGEALLQTAAERPELAAVVAEGAGIRSVREVMASPADAGPATVPFWAAVTVATTVLSGDTPPPALQDLLPRIAPRPLLLIHAGMGQGGEHLNGQYRQVAGDTAQRWMLADGTHVNAVHEAPAEYEHRVVQFFDHSLLGR